MDKKTFALRMLSTAVGYLGVSRDNNRDQVTRFLNLFGLPFAGPDGSPFPFCDAGVGYSAAKAYCDLWGIGYSTASAVSVFRSVLPDVADLSFLPSAACRVTQADAVRRGSWLDAGDLDANPADILPGWLVLYSWPDGTEADHIGIVEHDNGDTISTIEFNTSGIIDGSQVNGGAVARKVRPYNHILGFVRTY